MKFSLLAITTFVACALAVPSPEYEFIQADVVKRPAPAEAKHLLKRGTVSTPIYNQLSYYQVDLNLGTPPQQMTALLDTGSSDMWFFSNIAGQTGIPTFNPSRSSTYHNNYTDFQIGYVSGSAEGTWGYDNVQIAGTPIQRQSFALVANGQGLNGVPGLIGVGLPALESTNVNGGFFSNRYTYSNVPLSLYQQGRISTPTYSLFLNSIDSGSGTILFGAVDHSKYVGQLYSVPRVHRSRFNINFDSISANGQSLGNVGSATLDSGTTLGSLPDQVCQGLAQAMGLQQDPNTGVYIAPQSQVNLNQPITVSISGVQFNLKAGNFLIDSAKLGDPFPTGMYVLGFTPSSTTQNQIILGDVFLRNFYIVYDLANPQIGLALANFANNPQPQMEPILNQYIPQAKVVANTPAQTAPAANYNPFSNLFNPFRNLFGGQDTGYDVSSDVNESIVMLDDEVIQN